MSETTQTAKQGVNLKGNISNKIFATTTALKGRLHWDPEAEGAGPKPADVYLGNITGEITGAEIKVGEYKGEMTESVIVTGNLAATLALKGGDAVVASSWFPPNAVGRIIHEAFKKLAPGETIIGSWEISATWSSKPVGYEYVIRSMIADTTHRMSRVLLEAAKRGAKLSPALLEMAHARVENVRSVSDALNGEEDAGTIEHNPETGEIAPTDDAETGMTEQREAATEKAHGKGKKAA